MTTFADLYKPVKDFFTKNYSVPALRIEAKAKSGPLSFTPTVQQNGDKTIATGVEIEQEFQLCNFSDATGKINLGSDGLVKSELKLKKIQSAPGLEVTGNYNAGLSSAAQDTCDTSATYKHGKVTATVGVNCLKNTFDSTVSHQCSPYFTWGAQAKFANFKFAGYAAGGAFSYKDAAVAATFNDKHEVTMGGVFNGPDKLAVGGEVVVGGNTKLTVGAQTQIGGSLFKAKASSTGAIGFSAQQKVTERITAIVSVDIDSSKANASNVGLKFNWE